MDDRVLGAYLRDFREEFSLADLGLTGPAAWSGCDVSLGVALVPARAWPAELVGVAQPAMRCGSAAKSLRVHFFTGLDRSWS